ncbi:Uncharacterised protein [uncultured archaeon]|nr:Uncharacterised protein [uncultured archaeon]
MSRRKFAIIVGCIALAAVLAAFALSGNRESKNNPAAPSNVSNPTGSNNGTPAAPENLEISSGWTITSYQDVNEDVYSGNKVEVFDSGGKSLGFYKSDFLEQIRIDGAGKGDGKGNPGKFLHYDYNVDNGKTYYLSDKSLGAYGNELVSWTSERASIAVNPPLPPGTIIRFKDLGSGKENSYGWVKELLMNKTFYADDKFFGVTGKKIDVYVGLQKTKNMEGAPESLLMRNVTIEIIRPR